MKQDSPLPLLLFWLTPPPPPPCNMIDHYILPRTSFSYLRLLANEIMWNVVRGFIDTLPEAFGEVQEEYIESIINTRRTVPRWKTCNRLANKYFEYVTTLLYVGAYLPEDATETVR